MPPRKKKGHPGRPPAKKGAIKLKDTKCFPVTSQDDLEVECRICGQKSSYIEFRRHNVEVHYNIATTADDGTVQDRRFYARQLSELSKIAGIKVFCCPTEDCNSTYKSHLGLAYHLEQCGKTDEEMQACAVECDICHEKFLAPNLAWHKRSHMLEVLIHEGSGISEVTRDISKRQSAIKAREVMQNVTEGNADDEPGYSKSKAKKEDATWSAEGRKDTDAAIHDITYIASDFLDTNMTDDKTIWDKPRRNYVDPLEETETNSLKALPEESIQEYLPSVQESVQFCVIQDSSPNKRSSRSNTYRRLNLFESEVDEVNGHVIVHTGGSVTCVAWHPSGKYLAVSNLRSIKDKLDFKRNENVIQIYEHFGKSQEDETESSEPEKNDLKLVLLIALNYGVISHMQWSSFWPKFETLKCDYIGYLAVACSDSTCRIIEIRKSYFQYEKPDSERIRCFLKKPEIILQFDKVLKVKTGECTRFDWHENNRFLVAGYNSGHVALYDLETRSKLLRCIKQVGDGDTETILYPFWIIRAHVMAIKGLCFDSSNPRYFVTGGKDRCMKVYDCELRMEVQERKVGLITDMCWIRGWIHVALALDAANTKSSSTHNYVRFYNLSTMHGRPNCAQLNSVTSVSFHNGLTLQAGEEGKISVTFFDQFWRECDFDRNKKKKNVVELVNTQVDDSSFKQFTEEKMSKYWLKEVDEESRIILNLVQHRLQTHALEDVPYDSVENFYRFYPYTRINKVAWSPSGDNYAVGYRNGLLVLLPFNFEKVYH